MTNLIEIERWEDGIYQLETSDAVVGGPDGIDNLQAKQLANRTRYLKRAIEARQSDFDAHVAAVDPHPQYATHADLAEKVAALVAQSPEALDTLSELAKALGNDPNFATTITTELATRAPIDSPVFTGMPRRPRLLSLIAVTGSRRLDLCSVRSAICRSAHGFSRPQMPFSRHLTRAVFIRSKLRPRLTRSRRLRL